MLIPDGATIFVPVWSLNHSYEDPEVYNPDRYLSYPKLAPDYARGADYQKRDHYTYGAGRRICAGLHLAERTQWRVLAAMLWAFEIRAVSQLDLGNYNEGLLHEPLPFEVQFVPRSEKHAGIVRKECVAFQALLSKWD